MVDLVSSAGSQASGFPLARLAAAVPRANPGITTKASDTQPSGRPGAAMAEINGYLQKTASDIQFQVDEASGRTFFKIVDTSTGLVLMQVPSVEVLAMSRKLKEVAKLAEASGVLVDKKG